MTVPPHQVVKARRAIDSLLRDGLYRYKQLEQLLGLLSWIGQVLPAAKAEPVVAAGWVITIHGAIPEHIVPMLSKADGAGVSLVLVPFFLPEWTSNLLQVHGEHRTSACKTPECTYIITKQPCSHTKQSLG